MSKHSGLKIMIYQCLKSTAFMIWVKLVGVVVQIISITSPPVVGLMSLILLVVWIALIGVVVTARHGCLSAWEHRVPVNCALPRQLASFVAS